MSNENQIALTAANLVDGMARDNVSLPHVEATPRFFLSARHPVSFPRLSRETQNDLCMAVVNEIRERRGARPYTRLTENGYGF